MRRFLVTFLMIIACYILQTTVFGYFNMGGIVPNCLIIVVVSCGLMRGERHGLVAGFVAGLIVDIFCADFIGFYALLYMYVGFLSGLFHRIFYPEDMLWSLGMITVSDFSYAFFVYILQFLLRGRFSIGHYFIHQIIPEVVYTTIVSLFLYPIILKINTWIDDIIQRSEKKFV